MFCSPEFADSLPTAIFSRNPGRMLSSLFSVESFRTSVVRHAEWRLFRVRRARFTFSRMSAARAIQINGFGLVHSAPLQNRANKSQMEFASEAQPTGPGLAIMICSLPIG